MYMQRTASGDAGNGLYTTIKYMRGASGIGMGTTIKHLRCTTSGAAGNGLGVTMKYLRCTTSAAANNGMSTAIIPPCSAASFEVNSEPHTGARPSVRLCVGPELARCVHGNVTSTSFELKLEIDLKYNFETGKPHLQKLVMINHHLVVFIQHDPSELRGP
jgi:hypothetical protein